MKFQGSKVLLTGASGGIGRAFVDEFLRSGNSKVYAGAVSLALALILLGIKTGYSQSAPTPAPTTKILAIGTINPGVDWAKVNAILPGEVKATVNLYLEGKIDQWYSLQDRKGVAFILNVTNPAAAREILEKLPLGQAHMMSFELISRSA
jgi:NAD(P)-dependent dehydrogenase (short-subunit alcohol dehydrogenase family)